MKPYSRKPTVWDLIQRRGVSLAEWDRHFGVASYAAHVVQCAVVGVEPATESEWLASRPAPSAQEEEVSQPEKNPELLVFVPLEEPREAVAEPTLRRGKGRKREADVTTEGDDVVPER